jgi:hypothetical protein
MADLRPIGAASHILFTFETLDLAAMQPRRM